MSAARALSSLYRQHALREVDLAFAEVLQRAGGVPEVALAGALAMRAVALGHSGFGLVRVDALLAELEATADLPETDAWNDILRSSPLVATGFHGDKRPLVLAAGRISLYRYATYEYDLARRLRGRAEFDSEFEDRQHSDRAPTAAAWLRAVFAIAPDQSLEPQALAVWLASRRRLTLITGGPGTGKTTTVARLLALLRHCGADPARIALAAPTGRAAARLGEAIAQAVARDREAGLLDAGLAESIPHQAQTLHRLLGWRFGDTRFRHDAGNPLPFDTIIVDEASMIDLPLMSKLVAAVSPEARLVLLGDPDQLPAVEAGHVFGTLCAAAGTGTLFSEPFAAAASQALRMSIPALERPRETAPPAPLLGCRVHLLRRYRQADAPALQELTQAVCDGDFDAVQRRLESTDRTLHWRRDGANALEPWLRREWLPGLSALTTAPDPIAALREARRLRMLTALRQGWSGSEYWNAWFARQLGGITTPWFPGRLIMITANSYRHGLFNGDIGIVWPGARGECAVWFENLDRAWHPRQLPAHESAFASTVHKAQGSEYERVLLLLPDRDSRVLSRELLYTGLTRAQGRVDLWADAAILAQAMARRAHSDTGLDAWLHDATE
ncbi:MAG: exodeoxyribonuclease V subunit alpha [Xanthomonadaceae bacterium]|jgi:exodeoxyribonuclease V alpha subunit|nr:exodeoxyribonuclease V subunit alpha [Xanthomonadaceae bacterium]